MKRTHRGHFEGTKYLRADGRWEWRITLPNGERRSFYGKTERAARDKKNQAIRDYEAGLARDNERLTVNQYLERWLEDTAANRVRPSTLATYTSHIETHIKPAMARVRLRELSPEHVNRMLAAIVRDGASPTTANRVRATLRTSLSAAVRARLVAHNAAKDSEPRTEKRMRVKPLTHDQARQLITATRSNVMGPLIEVAIYTGLRQGELLALTWEDIDLENETLTVRHTLTWQRNPSGKPKHIPVFSDPKTENSKRTIRIPKPAIAALERQKELIEEWEAAATVSRWRPIPGMDLVFPSMVGRPQNNSNVTNWLRGILEDLKLPHQRFHDLRHLTASLLLAEGMDIFTVKEILGHSQIAQTANTYGHLTKKLSDAAAEVLGTAIFEADSDDSSDGLTTKLTTNETVSDSMEVDE